jgi:ATP-dependent RNA helicase DeaD
VATDVVGRGIDVTGISHIVNFDIPQFCDDYIHRTGRTGRMGREGTAYTFVTPEEGGELTRIEMRIDILLKRGEIGDFQLVVPKKSLAQVEAEEKGEEATPPPPPPGRRRPKRYRQAL